MATIKIAGVHPFDGDYPFEATGFTGRELHTIKQISGVRAGELKEALLAGDYDLVVAFAVIVLRRAGRTVEPEQILDAEVGAITVDLGGDEDEGGGVVARPPVSPPSSGDANSSGGSGEATEPTSASGTSSGTDGASPPSRPSLTGLPGSATPADSDQETLAS